MSSYPTSPTSRCQIARDALAAQRLVPVIRSPNADDAVATARACVRGGLGTVELTMTTGDVFEAVAELAAEGIVVGLGTIRDVGTVADAAKAGASFVVSFYEPEGFTAAAVEADLLAIPGTFTPGEMARAQANGASVVKLFPAKHACPSYVKDAAVLLPDIRIVASGGISPTRESASPWLEAGALAVAVGSEIGTAATVGAKEVERRCRAGLAAVLTAAPT